MKSQVTLANPTNHSQITHLGVQINSGQPKLPQTQESLNSQKCGNHLVTKLEQAKLELKKTSYDLKSLLESAEFQDLNEVEIQKLKYFKKNEMKRLKREQKSKLSTSDESTFQSNHQMAVSLLRYEQEANKVIACKNHTDRALLLRQLRSQMETFAFKGFLQTLFEAGIREGMFESLFEMINEEPTIHHQRNFFLQACLFYDGSQVVLNLELVSQVLSEFRFLDLELGQCLGFFQLLYMNNSTAFSQLTLPQLIELERDMPMLAVQFCNFLKQYMSPYLKPFFEPTLLCLTPPIIKDIQELGGKSMFKDVPMEFLIDYIQILEYSFDTSFENFTNFNSQMQSYFIQYHYRLRHFNFGEATNFVAAALKRKDSKWIGSLNKVLSYFKSLIENVILRKEAQITQEILEATLNQDEEFIESIPDKKLESQIRVDPSSFWNYASKMNRSNLDFTTFLGTFMDGEVCPPIQQLLQKGKIEMLLPVQELCFKYIISRKNSIFSVVGIGNGKTILCNILAAHLAQTENKQIIVLNKHSSLSYRNGILFDQTFASQMNLLVGFDGKMINQDFNVIFMFEEEFSKYLESTQKPKSEIILILDEADQILFPEQQSSMNEKQLLQLKSKLIKFAEFSRIYAFSGTLTELEAQCVKQTFEAEIVYFPKLNHLKAMPNVLIQQSELSSKDEWLKTVSASVLKYCFQVPVLILVSPQQEKSVIKSIRHQASDQVNVISLINSKPIDLISSLKQMTVFNEVKGYPVYLIDESLCRGLDVKTTQEIEDKGGLLVIIAKVPSTTKVYEQALGRTQRLVNKGQHSIIIWNQSGKSFNQLLQEGDDKTQLNIRKLLPHLKAHSKNLVLPPNQILQTEPVSISIGDFELPNEIPVNEEVKIFRLGNELNDDECLDQKIADTQTRNLSEGTITKVKENLESANENVNIDSDFMNEGDFSIENCNSSKSAVPINENEEGKISGGQVNEEEIKLGKRLTRSHDNIREFHYEENNSQLESLAEPTQKIGKVSIEINDDQQMVSKQIKRIDQVGFDQMSKTEPANILRQSKRIKNNYLSEKVSLGDRFADAEEVSQIQIQRK